MSTTTVTGQVGTEQTSTQSKRNAAIALTVIALSLVSFFIGRATAPNHVSSAAQVATHAQLSPADRSIVANDVATTGTATAQLSPADRTLVANDVTTTGVTAAQLSPADRTLVANDVAPLISSKLSPTNRGQIANDDVAPVTPLSQANTTSCVAGRPC